jgi:multiple sugar transport system ATP-binding protein
MARVTLSKVEKTYPDGNKVVHGIDLDIRDGEFVVLVGPSGCGKSTTLRMVAGLEEITGGSISIDGRVVNDVHPKDRDIAMVFQNYALYPHMTVYDNIGFALRLRGLPKHEIDARVRRAAETLGLEQHLNRKPAALSGGQRQRVAVGRAIVREPKVFLFDEPLSNLDARLRVTTRAELKALQMRLRTTTIYVTHDQEEAMTLGDRVVVMHRGVVQQAGPPLEVYRRPVNRFVAGFLGTPPMNFIDGTLDAAGGRVRFTERGPGGFSVDLPDTLATRLATHAGAPVVLGVRPQAFALRASGDLPGVDLRVRICEPLGDAVDVQGVTMAGSTIVARLDLDELPAVDSVLPLTMDLSVAGIFEPGELGRNIAL